MRIKKIALLLCLLTLTSFVNAQITVTGKVIDNTNEPIEFANVVLLNKDKTEIVVGTITDESGYFKIETDKNEELTLQISYVGFTDFLKNITISTNLRDVTLKSNNELSEVVITARKKIIERKEDKIIGSTIICVGKDLSHH